jgi:hypothetical protein
MSESERAHRNRVEASLSKLASIHDEYIDARRTIRRQIEQKYEQELFKIRMRESLAANEAKKAGASLTKIGRAIGTSDWRTIQDRLALTADDFIEKESIPSFVFDRDAMTVTINWWEWEGERFEEPMVLPMAPERDEYGQPTGMLVPDHVAKEWPDHPLTRLFLAGDWAPFDAFESEIRDAWGK